MLLQPRTPPFARGASTRVSLPVAVVAGSLVLGLVSLLLPSAPTYDPFAWIIWGREITQLDLSTVDGPSWKPLPVLVTTLTAPLGEASPFAWVAVARAGAIAALALAVLLASRLAGPAAGVGAAGGLALMDWHLRNGALGNSEGLMVALVLAAVLAHLHGRRGWAFTLALGAGLLRPEAWPFLGLYSLWLVWDERARLRWVAGGLATLPVLWLLPEWWGSGNPFRASDRAQLPNPNSPAFADDPALEVARNALDTAPDAAVLGAVIGAVYALVGLAPSREARWTALTLTGMAAAWIGLVAAMTNRGFSGNQRYLLLPAALLLVLGAVGLAWAFRPLLRHVPVAVAALAGVALAAAFAWPDRERLEPTLRGIEYQAELYADLGTLVDRAGGPARVRGCGAPFTGPFLVPHVAWRLGLHTQAVRLAPRSPAAVFHVRTVHRARIVPPMSERGARVLARAGHWALTADCGARG